MFVAIVPAYNEEKTIGSVIRNLFEHVDKVVVVDDASGDSTLNKAREAGAIVLRHEINRGQGASIQTGHEYAKLIRADYVLHFDADNQFEVNDIGPALEFLKQHRADILFGSRFLDTRSQLPWSKRKVFLPLGRFLHKLFFQISSSDAHNGFRILNAEALNKIKITFDRMAHATEIAIQAKETGLKTVEFPVKVYYHEYGQGIGGGMKIVRDLIFGRFTR